MSRLALQLTSRNRRLLLAATVFSLLPTSVFALDGALIPLENPSIYDEKFAPPIRDIDLFGNIIGDVSKGIKNNIRQSYVKHFAWYRTSQPFFPNQISAKDSLTESESGYCLSMESQDSRYRSKNAYRSGKKYIDGVFETKSKNLKDLTRLYTTNDVDILISNNKKCTIGNNDTIFPAFVGDASQQKIIEIRLQVPDGIYRSNFVFRDMSRSNSVVCDRIRRDIAYSSNTSCKLEANNIHLSDVVRFEVFDMASDGGGALISQNISLRRPD